MRPYFILLVVIVALSGIGPLQATETELPPPGPCTENTALYYTQLTQGCNLSLRGNTFTLKQFGYYSQGGDGYHQVGAQNVTITPLVQDGELQLGFYSPLFSVSGFDQMIVKFEYILDPPPPILEDLSMELDAQSPVAPGFANIQTEVCASGQFVEDVCQGDYRSFELNHFGPGDINNSLQGRVTFPFTYQIHVRTVITLDANGASSQINGLKYDSSPIPEPATAAVSVAALGLGCWLRRRRS